MHYRYPFIAATEHLKLQVWAKASPVPGYNPALVRKDRCGNWIAYGDHGDTSSEYGWEIDHIHPASRGGSDALSNLQPLYWRNNRAKGDSLNWTCGIRAA